MAKIRDHRFKSWIVTVKYTTKKAAFQIDLPIEMKTFAEVCAGDESGRGGYIVAATESEVVAKFDRLAARYLVEGVKREKYLAVKIGHGSGDGFDYRDEFSHGGGKCAFLSIEWVPVERVDVAGKFQYKYRRHGTEKSFSYSDAIYLPWTREREDFLSQVTAGLQNIAERTAAFFGDETFPQKIDLGVVPVLSLKPLDQK